MFLSRIKADSLRNSEPFVLEHRSGGGLRSLMKISVALFCLLGISGLSFASGAYTPPPTPHAEKAKKKDDKKNKDDKKKDEKKNGNEKKSKDNGNGGKP